MSAALMRLGWDSNNPFWFLLGAGVIAYAMYQVLNKDDNKPVSSSDLKPG